MKKIDYFKEKIIEQLYYVDISHDQSHMSQYYLLFQQVLSDYRIKIMSCSTEEELFPCLQELNEQFFNHWDMMTEDLNNPFTVAMNDLYFYCHLNDIELWLKVLNDDYQQKLSIHFFDLLNKGKQFIQQHQVSTQYDFDETSRLCSHIIEKYHLKSINLTFIKPHQTITYLNKLDKHLTKMCEAMGMSYDLVGIHDTIGFVAGAHAEAFYRPDNKTISVGLNSIDKSTLLHEWIHAVDYYVGSWFSEGNCISEIEESILQGSEKSHQAFLSIKQLVQTISSEKQDILMDDIRQSLLQEATSKFFSQLLGDEFYLLSEDKKKHLHSQKAFRLVNNYLLYPFVSSNQEELIHFIFKYISQSPNIERNIVEPTEQLISLKTFFDELNKNIIGKESFYLLTSRLSMFSFKIDVWLDKKINQFVDFIQQPTHERVLKDISVNNYLIQPTELLARYFESQVFPAQTLIANLYDILSGIHIYKDGLDKDFIKNKNKMIETIFGKNKIVEHIKTSRKINQDSSIQPQSLME